MKKTFLMATAVAALPMAANAYLQVGASDSYIGMPCYTENSHEYVLYSNKAPLGFFFDEADMPKEDRCADTYAEQHAKNDSHCWVGVSDGILYHCAQDTWGGCAAYGSGWSDGAPAIENWTACGNNRVRRGSSIWDNEVETGDYTCETVYDYSDLDYGCAAGYYVSAGSGENITCTKCPTSGGTAGQSEIGNTDITGCYIPDGSSFSDDNGSGTIQGGKCYWKN